MPTMVRRAWVIAATLSCLSACEVPLEQTARVATTIAITPSSTVSLSAIGATQQLTASVKDQNGDTLANASIIWSTSNVAFVAVNASGLATAVANGSAQITAKSESLSASVTVTVAQAAAQLIKISGDAQTDTVGQQLPQPLVVQVNDATGHAMTGVSVGFAATAGSGSTGSASATTNASGQAQTTWTLGQTAGNQTAGATVGTLPVLSFAATATAGPPTSVAKQAGDGQIAATGQAVPVRPSVLVRDAFNNPKPGATVTFATTAGHGSVTGATQTTNVSGVATVGSWTLGNQGTDTLRATVTGSGISGNPAIFTATSTSPPVATTVELTPGTPFTLTAIAATRQITAVVRDQNGNAMTGAPVAWATSNALAVTVNTTGLATAVLNGSADITATSGSANASVTVTVAQAAAQVVKVSGDAQADTVAQLLSQPLVVQVNDATGHAILGVTVGFAATAGSGSTGSMSATTNASGQAQTTWTLGQTAGNQTARATVGALPVVSFTASATADRPASVAKQAGDGQTAVISLPVAVRPAVIVRDAFNNPAPGAAVTFATTAGNGTLTSASQTTNAQGIATVGSWTLGAVAGIDTLRATVTGSGISGNPAVFTATATAVSTTPGLTLIVSNLNSALYVTAPPGDTDRIFVVQQSGAIRVLRHDSLLATPFLNLSGIISYGGERGLLSLAFHPNYAGNGFFYVDYTAPNGALTVARYHVSANANVGDAASAQVLLSIPHSQNSNHNGGQIQFGPDGYLYIGTGDGGGGGDPDENGQDSTVRLGKILRIDVDGGSPYVVPATNPFVGRPPAVPEIWAYGLRNPWRFSFDRLTQDLYIADVGQDDWEEVDFAPAGDAGGHNYGWNRMEGTHCYPPGSSCNSNGLTLPVYDYAHGPGSSLGCSVTGGYVYRGTRLPTLSGRYFFAEYCAGWIRSFRMQGGVATDVQSHFGTVTNITSFGQDARGELYITRENGQVYRIAPQ